MLQAKYQKYSPMTDSNAVIQLKDWLHPFLLTLKELLEYLSRGQSIIWFQRALGT